MSSENNKKFRISDKLNLREILIFIGKFFVFSGFLFALFSFISSDYYTFIFEISKPIIEYFHPEHNVALKKDINFSLVGSFTNIIPFIALVLATPKILRNRKIKIIALGGVILLLLQVIFMVSTISIPLEIKEKEVQVNHQLDKELDELWEILSKESEKDIAEELERLQNEGKSQAEISGIVEQLRSYECEKISDEKIKTLCTELITEYKKREDELKKERQKEIKPSWLTTTVSSFLGGMGMIIFPFILWVVLCYSYFVQEKFAVRKEEKSKTKKKLKKKFKY